MPLPRAYGRRACSTSATPPVSSTTRGRRCPGTRTRPSGCWRSRRALGRARLARLGAARGPGGQRGRAGTGPPPRRHVESIRELAVAGGGAIDADTFVGEASYRAALHAAGGACAMTRALLARRGRRRASARCAPPATTPNRSGRWASACSTTSPIAAALAIARARGASASSSSTGTSTTATAPPRPSADAPTSSSSASTRPGSTPAPAPSADVGSGEGEGYTINLPVPAGSRRGALALAARAHRRSRVATHSTPTSSWSRPASTPTATTRWPAAGWRPTPSPRWPATSATSPRGSRRPLGAVLEGGYEPAALADSVVATLAALGGDGEATEIAPDPLLTSRAAAGVARHWDL